MYKVIIADDEKVIRDGLKNLVQWNELGFEVVDVFCDGDDVIEYLEYMPVDVVLTDIRMPHKTGIDIAKYIYESQLFCKVVFISGHKEFELAVQGMKYGVEDYILKPSKVEEVKEVFQKLKSQLDARKKNLETQKAAEERWQQALPLLEEKFVNDLIMGVLESKSYIEQRMELLYPGIDSYACPCILVNMEIDNYQDFIQSTWNYTSEQFDDAVYNFVKIVGGDASFHVIYKYKSRIKVFVIMKTCQESKAENIAMCKAQIDSFAEKFSEVFRVTVITEIESVFSNIYQVVDERESIISGSVTAENADLHLQEQKKLIISNVMLGNISTAKKILHNIMKNLKWETLQYKRNFLVTVFSSISEFLRENNRLLFQEVQPFINYQSMFNMSTEEELLVYCDRIFDKMKMMGGMDSHMDTDSLINRAKVYIDNHILEDISQEDLAEELFLSKAHLSRMFKKQTGETLLSYVTRKKMDKAAELLHDPQYKTYQVGEMLGYKTPRYFSKLFYNFIGYYPSQYRKQVLNMGGTGDEEK